MSDDEYKRLCRSFSTAWLKASAASPSVGMTERHVALIREVISEREGQSDG